MSVVGFGAYRVSIRSKVHKEALVEAVKANIKLIDTSANYTNGESEELIGQVLKENPNHRPLIMTKGGYVQGSNLVLLEKLNQAGKALEDLVVIDEHLKHSIHPDFLESQINQSLTRLGIDQIDYYLLHNPEYYFQTENANADEYYRRILNAFLYLETKVLEGKIKSYGISSNNLILAKNDPKATSIDRLLELKKEYKLKNFNVVQFPFNLIEIGALESGDEFGEKSLIDTCMENGMITVGNRPLNAFSNNQLVRLATYEKMYADLDESVAIVHFNHCLKLMKEKWTELSDELIDEQDFDEIELVNQFKEIWNKLKTPDAVDQVYFGNLFPFLARIWGGAGLSKEEAAPFYELYEISQKYARLNMSQTALNFKKQAMSFGLLQETNSQDFALDCIQTYLDYGLDYVLVGMKRAEYVQSLKQLF